ncbi:MAG: TRAFs-binding domain-containing protein [Chryseolinea sp.]
MSDIAQLENLIRLGHYARARNLAQELLTNDADLKVKQLYALSLSKSGVPEAAQEYLEGVAATHPDDAETMGILGGIYKELFKKNQSSKFAIQSRDTYDKNFQLTKNYYTGINAATMSMLAGNARRGKEIAQEVLTILKHSDTDFWEAATQGEAFFILKDRAKSEDAYRRARAMAGTDWGKINSVYNQLWLLKHYLPVPGELLKIFSPPVVVSFTGHMMDHPERPTPRFPDYIEGDVKSAIVSAIRTLNAKIGYTSVACGADILFAEAMDEEGGEVNLYLPFKQEDFIESSVRFAGAQWVERFMRLVNKHPVTFVTPDGYENHPDLFNLTTSILFGLSSLRSAANHQEPMLLTVLSDRDLAKKAGGVRDTLSVWPFRKNHVTINPDVYLKGTTAASVDAIRAEQQAYDRPVLYLVCCDLDTDEKINATLMAALEDASLPPAAVDVKGNHLIACFKTIFSAFEFCELVTKTMIKPFQQKNTMRISLHVGPLQINTDNVRQQLSGYLIDTLERLHTMTLAGSIYATSLIAAILALEPQKYSFDYVDTVASAGNTKDLDVFKVRIMKRI